MLVAGRSNLKLLRTGFALWSIQSIKNCIQSVQASIITNLQEGNTNLKTLRMEGYVK
jgi:hypothetical protein